MVIPFVVLDKLEKINDTEHYEGFFCRKDGTICCKPQRLYNKCFVIKTGEQFEIEDDEPVYKAYFEGRGRLRNVFRESEKSEDSNVQYHPAYGIISFSRANYGAGVNLFGSSIKHDTPIVMKVKHGCIERGLNRDWYHGNGNIIEIEMSQSQFGEMISGLNSQSGDGTPCTIRFTEMEGRIENRGDYESKPEQYRKEFSKQIDGSTDILDDSISTIKELLEERKTFRKKDIETVLNALLKVRNDISCNAEYMMESFNEQMEKTMYEAKSEIESFMQNQINKYGINAIEDKQNKIVEF